MNSFVKQNMLEHELSQCLCVYLVQGKDMTVKGGYLIHKEQV